ncbi:MAG: M48 family metallopeptidase [Faecalibacterium sp.]|nr:M48 family metallopeptidase [Faecalibacterium sp.]
MEKRGTEQRRCTPGGVEYILTRKAVKNINLHLRPDGAAAVSAGPHAPLARIESFVDARAEWIARVRAEQAAHRAAEQARPLPDKAAALAHFTAMSDEVFPAFSHVLQGRKPIIKVRDMSTRWGVCQTRKKQITFALRLYEMPPAAQIYVVVHEYCHFLVPNHSAAFWREVARLLPDWKARRKLLRG